jgi:hypothetical protein
MLLSVILYGSRARGDYRAKSDVDLLGVIESGPVRKEISAGGASFYHYPAKLLVKNASDGDLFIYHLVSEGIVLHDTIGFYEGIGRLFKLRSSYKSEIQLSSIIVQFFLSRPKLLVRKSARKRLIWALRTLLIAKSAEHKVPRFSSTALDSFAGVNGFKDMVDNRNQLDILNSVKVSRRILQKFGDIDFLASHWPDEINAQQEFMREFGGMVADTLRFIQPIGLVRGRPKWIKSIAADPDAVFYPD